MDCSLNILRYCEMRIGKLENWRTRREKKGKGKRKIASVFDGRLLVEESDMQRNKVLKTFKGEAPITCTTISRYTGTSVTKFKD